MSEDYLTPGALPITPERQPYDHELLDNFGIMLQVDGFVLVNIPTFKFEDKAYAIKTWTLPATEVPHILGDFLYTEACYQVILTALKRNLQTHIYSIRIKRHTLMNVESDRLVAVLAKYPRLWIRSARVPNFTRSSLFVP